MSSSSRTGRPSRACRTWLVADVKEEETAIIMADPDVPDDNRQTQGPSPESRARVLCWNLMQWTKVVLALKPVPEDSFPFAHEAMLALDVRKQTLFSLMDTAAMFRALVEIPDEIPTENNKLQWTAFVRDHCDWSGADRVSVPVLLKRIQHRLIDPRKSKFPPPEKSGVVKDLLDYLEAINHRFADLGREIRSSEIDPKLDDMAEFMTIAPVELLIRDTTLVNVLYALRNSRVHAMRTPGDAVEVWSTIEDEPSYQGSQTSRSYIVSPTELHLVFPESFVARLLRAGIDSLRPFLVAKGVDPYDSLRDSSAWELRDFTPMKVWAAP